MNSIAALTKRTLVVPSLPPIDKYIAAKRVMLDFDDVNFKVAFCDVNIPGPTHYKEWDGQVEGSAILIDVGDEKYHGRCLSASQMQKMKSATEHSGTWNKLQELANTNNSSGDLKKPDHAVAKLIREIPHTFADRKRGELETWNYGMDVVNSYFWRQNRREWEALFTDPQFAKLRQIFEGFNTKGDGLEDFTLPLYFRKLFRSGRPESVILQKMSWWLDHAKLVQSRHAAARAKKFQDKTRIFEIQGSGPAGLVKIVDYFEGGAFTYNVLGTGQLALGAVRNPSGGVAIITSSKHKVDLEGLHKELDRLEPTRWYLEGRFAAGQMLMNQSWQFIGVTPTQLTDDGLIDAIVKHVKYSGRK